MDDMTFYDSFEEMMEAEREAREAADGRVKPTQASVKPGQYFINFRHGPELPIFGEILDTRKLGANPEEQRYIDETYAQPLMGFFKPCKAYSAACEWGEVGDVHLSEIDAIIDKELFNYYREQTWRPLTGHERVQRRANFLLDELRPLSQHDDLCFSPYAYSPESDTIYIDVLPKSSPLWPITAYTFGKQEGMKYDRNLNVYGIDGQPRVSYSGQVWVRYIGDFLDGSKVGLHVWAQQPSHGEAEEQLARFYGLFRERDGLEPIEVFKKFYF